MLIYDPDKPDTRSTAAKLLDLNARIEELPRLRKQEEDNKRHTPDSLNEQLRRIAKTEDILLEQREILERSTL